MRLQTRQIDSSSLVQNSLQNRNQRLTVSPDLLVESDTGVESSTKKLLTIDGEQTNR